jgi:2-methylcitrate dehydratase PrpD
MTYVLTNSETEPSVEAARDVGAVMAEHIAQTGFEDVPESALRMAKYCILDTIGVTLAGAGAPGVEAVLDVVREQGGRQEASVWGYGLRVPAAMAAFANGAMSHPLDYDDVNHDLGLHLSTPTVPSALAMAERRGSSGRDVVLAVALANDFANRLGYSHKWQLNVPGIAWFTTPLFGFFTATAAAGKMLGLDGERLFNALGIAFCQAGCSLEIRHSPGSELAGLYAAWPNKCGIYSALLAERGVPGVPTLFEGKLGFFNMFFKGEWERSALTDDLGIKFRGEEVSIKPYAACAGTHSAIDAALAIAGRVEPDAIAEVEITVGTWPIWNLCQPETRKRPRTSMDARFSVPWSVAVALADRKVTLRDFAYENLENDRVLALADKVKAVFDESIKSPDDDVLSPVRVIVTTKSGERYEETVSRSRGRYPDSLSEEEIVAKFSDCATHAVRPLPAAQLDELVEKVLHLEDVDDVRELTALLRPSDSS